MCAFFLVDLRHELAVYHIMKLVLILIIPVAHDLG